MAGLAGYALTVGGFATVGALIASRLPRTPIGWLFLGYSLIGLAALFFVRSFVTETKGRSLEKIEFDLRERAGA
jgi:membrane protein implicated in regulation of membrane protease activity